MPVGPRARVRERGAAGVLLAELADKYEALATQGAGQPGRTLVRRDEMRAIASRFPAALREWDEAPAGAVRALPTLWEDSVRTLGGSRWDVLRQVVFPGVLPGLFGGLSVGMGVAWISVVSAEMISGRLGVGYRTWQAYTVLDYPSVFVGIITIDIALQILALVACFTAQVHGALAMPGTRRALQILATSAHFTPVQSLR